MVEIRLIDYIEDTKKRQISKIRLQETGKKRSISMEQIKEKQQNRIQILTTLDQNYLPRLQVLLTSVYLNNPGEQADIWLMHSRIPAEALEPVSELCRLFGFGFSAVQIDGSSFQGAPVSRQYPKEMYYRLLASQFLPEDLHRIIYLDPDILVINSLRPLWDMDMEGNLFAAASHTGMTELANNINQIRLETDHDYYNSGVLLMDLDRARDEISAQEIFDYVKEHGKELLLPDQDVLNALYGRRTIDLDDAVWNYDTRNYNTYLLRSTGVCDMDWVMKNTSVLHFCGRSKPWQKGYIHRFGILYKHYMELTRRYISCTERDKSSR